jgi:hypothetical protein
MRRSNYAVGLASASAIEKKPVPAMEPAFLLPIHYLDTWFWPILIDLKQF